MPTVPRVHHLVGTAEIAEMLGLTRQRVWQVTTRPDFPAPVVILIGGSVWERQAVADWIEASRRGPGEHAET